MLRGQGRHHRRARHELVAEQFPQWTHLPVRPVELDGWDNTTFRLGDDMSVRCRAARSTRSRSTRNTLAAGARTAIAVADPGRRGAGPATLPATVVGVPLDAGGRCPGEPSPTVGALGRPRGVPGRAVPHRRGRPARRPAQSQLLRAGSRFDFWHDHSDQLHCSSTIDVRATASLGQRRSTPSSRCHRYGCTATSAAPTCPCAMAGWRR